METNSNIHQRIAGYALLAVVMVTMLIAFGYWMGNGTLRAFKSDGVSCQYNFPNIDVKEPAIHVN